VPEEKSSGNAALDRARQFEQEMGLVQPPPPETIAGSSSFLEKLFPGLSNKMADATDAERQTVAREALKAQAESDPDSILNIFGMDAMKEMLAKLSSALGPSRTGNPDAAPTGSQPRHRRSGHAPDRRRTAAA
jgi:hypothetical protein